MNAVVIAPGESLTQEQCDATRGVELTIAVSDAYRLVPWADAIAATDRAWWKERPEVLAMPCKKFTPCMIPGTEHVKSEYIGTHSSSGVLGMFVAKLLGATKVLLLGFDNRGSHFFGEHTGALKNTPPGRFKIFEDQFFHLNGHFKIEKIGVKNATQGTALKAIETTTLEEGMTWLMS